ncbi:TM7S3/TM198-like domain-containing protein [Qiania dongpingensis]|uniref:DUF4203 domain-containing protein n=1 Tax=Qiania dongpingensis TaxID=2763669 RepID=A0A7G9G669_9FIRM|nr:DUF4203 domain-containing protein [Qiania dongpingensis]QNM06301.1 DUF4203 domain-containing protein [Qiania dongpingensis]
MGNTFMEMSGIKNFGQQGIAVIEDFFNRMPKGVAGVLAILALVLILLQCFMGYKLLKIWVTLIGGLIGLIVGIIVGTQFIKNSTVTAVVALLLMLLLGVLAYKIYQVGVFLLGTFSSYLVALGLFGSMAGKETWWVYALAIAAGIAVGVLSVIFMRPAIILSTAVTNGLSAGSRLMALGGVTDQTPVLVAGIILSALGIFVQFSTTKTEKRRRYKRY